MLELIAGVAEKDRARRGGNGGNHATDAAFEVGQAGERERDIELVGHALGADRLGVAFAVGPEALAFDRPRGERRCANAREAGEDPGKCFGLILLGGAFEEEIAGVRAG